MVGEEGHRPHLAVHFHLGHHAAQRAGVMLAGRTGQADQVVPQDVPLATRLEFALHPAAEIVLGARHPEHFPHGQLGQMGKIHIGLVEDDDLPGPHPRAEFLRPPAFVFAGGVHDGAAGQESLQVQPQMTFGRGFAAAMFGPVQARCDEFDGGDPGQLLGGWDAD